MGWGLGLVSDGWMVRWENLDVSKSTNHDWLAGFRNHEQLGCIDRGLSKGPQQCGGGSYQPDSNRLNLKVGGSDPISVPKS